MTPQRRARESFTLPPGRSIALSAIVAAVERTYQLLPGALKEHTNRVEISHPRQLAMYLAYVLTVQSLPQIGRAFAMHHTTVIHSIRKLEALVESNDIVRSLVGSLKDELTQPVQREMFPKPITQIFEVPGRREKRG